MDEATIWLEANIFMISSSSAIDTYCVCLKRSLQVFFLVYLLIHNIHTEFLFIIITEVYAINVMVEGRVSDFSK